MTGWLAPTGELIICEGHSHLDKARELCTLLHFEDKEKTPDDILLSRGWVRISRCIYGYDLGYMFWMPDALSSCQRSVLKQFVEVFGNECSAEGRNTLHKYGIIDD